MRRGQRRPALAFSGLSAAMCVLGFTLTTAVVRSQSLRTGTINATVLPLGIGATVRAELLGGIEVANHDRVRVLGADASGTCRFTEMYLGAYWVTATAPGYVGETTSVQVSEGEEIAVEFSLEPGGFISGRITPAESNVRIFAYEAKRGLSGIRLAHPKTGEYRIGPVAPGTYDLAIVSPAYRAVRGIPPSLGRQPSPEEKSAVVEVFSHLGRAYRTPDFDAILALYSRSYVAGWKSYEDLVRDVEGQKARHAELLRTGQLSDEETQVSYSVENVQVDDTRAMAIVRRRHRVAERPTGKLLREYDIVFRFDLALEDGSWRITYEDALDPWESDTVIVEDGRIAGIKVAAKEETSGHDFDLSSIPRRSPKDAPEASGNAQ